MSLRLLCMKREGGSVTRPYRKHYPDFPTFSPSLAWLERGPGG
jgi:hypothetical protein